MKAHLLNRCNQCGHAWFPQGFDLSRRCPKCAAADVDLTGRLYLAILVLITVAAGLFWASDRTPRHGSSTATLATPGPEKKARHLGSSGTSAVPSAPRITTEAEGRAEALRLYPDLGVANSPLNREFVTRYHSYQRLEPDFFQDPTWPVKLVKESAAIVGTQPSTQ